MSFAFPLGLLALLAVPLVYLWYRRWRRRTPPAAVPFPNLDLVVASAPRPRLRRHVPLALAALACLALVLALGRPEISRAVPREQATIMLAVDVSGSMAAPDVEPTRLRAAQAAALRFADRVPRQYEVGLVTFSRTASLVVPPTTDRVALRAAVEGLVAQGGTAIGDAVVTSIDAIRARQGDVPTLRSARILLLSDGSNTNGVGLSEAAAQATEAGVPVYTVALGTEDGFTPDGQHVPPDPDALATLAADTGGRAYESRDAESVGEVYERLGSFIGTESVRTEVTGWAAGIGALLLVGAGAGYWRFGPRLP
jgi:Ca-activated chloride channel family protein